nr:MAG TPA: hypothetical protein [Caudoviricetes sp.]
MVLSSLINPIKFISFKDIFTYLNFLIIYITIIRPAYYI